jgi:hypothetical protein
LRTHNTRPGVITAVKLTEGVGGLQSSITHLYTALYDLFSHQPAAGQPAALAVAAAAVAAQDHLH